MGQMKLSDFDEELKRRGFDAVLPTTRTRYINWGIQRVRRLTRWNFEEASRSITKPAGTYSISLASDLPEAQEITAVFCTDLERKLKPLDQERFLKRWRILDLSNSRYRSEPSYYYVNEGQLWVLPPLQTARTVRVHYHQKVVYLSNPGDVPGTPNDFDDLILQATLIYCHRKVNEVDRARDAELELASMVDEILDQDGSLMEELPERTIPDNSWV